MTAAMVLPRFSDLCREISVTKQESLTLPPLRTFPESFSRETPPSPTGSTSSSARRSSLSIQYLSNSDGNPEAQSSYFDNQFRVCDSCSRDSSPEDDDHSSEYDDDEEDTEAEQSQQEQQSPLELVLFKSSQPKGEAQAPVQPRVKKVKYHICEICQKAFPRPSGLRAHMNMHTKEKPFECGFPGCPKKFSVSSNAKRHLRTHGVGLSPSDEPLPLPYVVDFEEPVVVPNDGDDTAASSSSEPLNLRWMPLGVGSRRACRQQQNRNCIS